MESYLPILEELKKEIRQARLRASILVNRELLGIYYRIGKTILEQQKQQGWGSKIIERISNDLHYEFPDMQGLSARNLKYMRKFADTYPDFSIVQATLAQLTWYHHLTLLDKVKNEEERLFYIHETAQQGWSRDVMVNQIESGYWLRKGKIASNFDRTLPDFQSDLAKQAFKDPYRFDFLALADNYKEKDLENGLIEHITTFLLELGKGFAYVGKQHLIEVDNREFFIDLLFYHLTLRCYVVIELKAVDFEPEFVGKLNFYLSAVDDQLRHPTDQPSIGLLICRHKSKFMAEYALRDIQKPIGISEYSLTEALPENLKSTLPSIEEIENNLSNS